MKRFLIVAVAFTLILTSVGCGRYGETNELTETTQEEPYETFAHHDYTTLDFTSIEELIESHKAVREGKAVGRLAEKAEQENFMELEKIYAPTVIPEEYHLYEIMVTEFYVRFIYLLESDMVSPDAVSQAFSEHQNFDFSFWRQGIDVTMDEALRRRNAAEEDLIDGKYLFDEPNSLTWEFDGVLFDLAVPLPLLEKQPDEQAKIAEMIKYAEVEDVDLGG